MEPAALLRLIAPHFAAAGVTRVADVTGLDRIGIPVALATRPNSRSLSVSQGKGDSRDAAFAGAAMEALELAAAERLPEALRTSTLNAVRGTGEPVIGLEVSTRCRVDRLGRNELLLWTEGRDLAAERGVAVPWSLVGVDYRPDPAGYHPAFQVSTDGLASGATAEEAIFHGLCELVERDASALLEFMPTEALSRRLRTIPAEDAPEAAALQEMIEAAGCRLTIIDMTTNLGVPAFTAFISDSAAGGAEPLPRYVHSGGCGCHPDPARALMKAVLEAAQSRITRIAGSRDDLPPDVYGAAESVERQGLLELFALADAPVEQPVELSASTSIDDPVEGIRWIVERLMRHGIDQIVAVPIANDFDIAVMRMVVPGLQTELTGGRSKLGLRALSAVLGRLN